MKLCVREFSGRFLFSIDGQIYDRESISYFRINIME